MNINKIYRPVVATIAVLFIPLVGMQLSSEWDWDLTDFLVIGVLVFSTGFLYEVISSKIKDKNKRILLAIILAAVLLAIWGELAVGIFGTPFAGN